MLDYLGQKGLIDNVVVFKTPQEEIRSGAEFIAPNIEVKNGQPIG